ncbi:MAG: 3-dehydroquinate synthase [Alphaproteobacteria bacterium]|jgi:3-dehydroquinate synthase|nr:3-dehydroquinate synthase [Alphaproteobacteria bacterium]MDP6815841.1 3-dehydroquinate synthase [Alphaproteobacteria bacterium]
MKQDVHQQDQDGRDLGGRYEPAETYVQRFSLPVEFPVVFTRHLFDPDNGVLVETVRRLEPDRRHRLFVVVDDNVARAWPHLDDAIARYATHHAEHLELLAPPQTIAGGEHVKNSDGEVDSLLRRLLDLGIDRHSYVVAIGGGAVLDLVGYAAAICHRGIRHIRVPTTVLAQNDSGVGVKNGVNTFGVKNFVGTFAPPFAVLNDFDFITTLSSRDKLAGMAEAVKVALIRDGDFFRWLEANTGALTGFETAAMIRMIRRCAELHLQHIAGGGDPFEQGSARPLDYGHWSAHKLEALTDHGLRHGEAVAIGMALDARYAVLRGMLPAAEGERICRLLENLGLSLWHDSLGATGAAGELPVLDGLREFREHLGGELTITLIAEIGRGVEVNSIDDGTMRTAIDWLRQRAESR